MEIFLTGVFYGSLWGIAEAVLGYVLHILPPGIAGFVMFPVGFYFMRKTYLKAQNINAVLMTGIIAAGIKLINLIFPILPVIKTVNPTVSILIEVLVVAAAFKLFLRERGKLSVKAAVFASLAWRALFVFYAFVLTLFAVPSELLERGLVSLSGFIFLEGAVNAALIYAYTRLEKTELPVDLPAGAGYIVRPLIPALVFITALAATAGFTYIRIA